MLKLCVSVLCVCLLLVGGASAQPGGFEGDVSTMLDGNLLRWDSTYGLYGQASVDGATLVWPPGTYAVGPELFLGVKLPQAFTLKPTSFNDIPHRPRSDLTILAYGVKIVITDPTIGGLHFEECHGITIKGLTVAYDVLPYTQGTVTNKYQFGTPGNLQDAFDVQIDSAYLGLDDSRFVFGENQPANQSGYLALFDPATDLMKADMIRTALRIDAPIALGGNTFGCQLVASQSNSYQDIEIGDRFVYVMRNNAGGSFRFLGSEPTAAHRAPVTLEDCTGKASPQVFALLDGCPDIASTGQSIVRNCEITTGNPDRLASTVGGAVAPSSCRVGPLIEDCTFARMMDDGVNIELNGRLVQSPAPGPSGTVTLDLAGGPRVAPGDLLQLVDPQTGETLHVTATSVTSITPGAPPEDPITVTLAQTVFDVQGTGNPLLPGDSWHCFNASLANPGFEVRDNTFRDHRGKGAVISSMLGSFHDNLVEGSSMNGIAVVNYYGFSGIPQFITIEDNTIRNCGYSFRGNVLSGKNVAKGASIWVGALTPHFKQFPTIGTPTSGYHVVLGNTIEDWKLAGIYLNSMTQTLVKDNSLSGTVDPGHRALIVATPSTNSTVLNLDVTQSSGLDYAVRDDTVMADMVSISNVFVTAPTQVFEP